MENKNQRSKKTNELLLKNGQVIDPVSGIDGQALDVFISGGTIAEIGAGLKKPGAETIDLKGKVVAPGLIDMHVHLREPGREDEETICSGSRAAAMGGFTSVACMPNTTPEIDNEGIVEFIYSQARTAGIVNVFPIVSMTVGNQGERLAEIGMLKKAGAVAISDDAHPTLDSGIMRLAMEYAQMFELPLLLHCEDVRLSEQGVMNEGYYSTVLGLCGIPNAAEEIMVSRALILAGMTGARVHIAHVSTAGSVREIRKAKMNGTRVTAEVTPHHFSLTDACVVDYDTNYKMNPPLRSGDDIEEIFKGLQDGTIDVIATDHAPHADYEKNVEFAFAPFGIIGLETALPLSVKALVEAQRLTVAEIIQKMSSNPARILGLTAKGRLSVGADADITVIDVKKEVTVDVSSFQSKSRNSPFDQWKLRGAPYMTIVGGTVVMREGKLTIQGDVKKEGFTIL